jgi:gamma-glutamylcysteine synthetase
MTKTTYSLNAKKVKTILSNTGNAIALVNLNPIRVKTKYNTASRYQILGQIMKSSNQPRGYKLKASDAVEGVGGLELHSQAQVPKLDAAVLATRHNHLLLVQNKKADQYAAW